MIEPIKHQLVFPGRPPTQNAETRKHGYAQATTIAEYRKAAFILAAKEKMERCASIRVVVWPEYRNARSMQNGVFQQLAARLAFFECDAGERRQVDHPKRHDRQGDDRGHAGDLLGLDAESHVLESEIGRAHV